MIYTIGESIIDIILKGIAPQSIQIGGSALNTAISLGRLGAPISFVSEVGNDVLGTHVVQFLEQNSITTTNILRIPNKSSLALAFLNENNDASYQFYKDLPEECNCKIHRIHKNDIILISSSFVISKRTRFFVENTICNAKSNNALIMYDPNIRTSVKSNSEEFMWIMENFKSADIVRASDEDLFHIFKTQDSNTIYKKLRNLGVKILIITKNSNNVELISSIFTIQVTVPEIVPVSTIGAGDTFNAGILYALYKTDDIQKALHDRKFWESALNFSIACSAIVCCSLENYISKECVKTLPDIEF